MIGKKLLIKTILFKIVLFLPVTGISPVFSQYNPPTGSGGLFELYSPAFLAGGASTVSTLSPAGDVLNPAASGAKQRLTLDLSYAGLIDTGGEAGLGHVINGGVTLPTRGGVISGSAHFITSPFSSLDLGTFGGVNVSFAKDLFPKVLVGVGLGTMFGSDWGLGLDLGFVHLAGKLGFIKDFRWGVAIRGMGKGYKPAGESNAFPAPFTPSIGAHFGLIDTKAFDLALSTDLSFPSFQNIRANVGTELVFGNFLFLQAGGLFDLNETSSDTARDFPVSFGLAVKFAADIRRDRSELKTSLAAAPLQNKIWAVGAGVNVPIGLIDRNPPVIRMAPTLEYISPNLDGVQDDLIKPIEITDERFVKGYRFIILNSDGEQVREIVNKDERPENVTVKNILDRLLYVKTGINIPENLRWDGRSAKGSVAPDGSYTYKVEAWDDNGNRAESEAGTVVVDNTPPHIEISSPYLIFSPNEDGNKDVLSLAQGGSEELLWRGSVQNVSGEEVVSLKWKNAEPPSFDWGGRDSTGILCPDGVYSYRMTSTDRAGNRGSARIDNIIINTQATPINIIISDSFFSPNGDGLKDSLVLSLDVPVTTGIEKWNLTISDSQGQARKKFQGSGTIPVAIEFDGTDDAGMRLPESLYGGKLEVLYVNGNNPSAVTPDFTIDLTPPSAALSADLSLFSPNGDGIKDTVTIYQESSEEPLWEGFIKNSAGLTVRNFSWRGRADARISWDGRADDGRLVPDGIYFYSVAATDRAGNSGQSKQLKFKLDTEETEVFLTIDSGYFSPNADGVKDRIMVTPILKVATEVQSFSLSILNSEEQVVRNIQGQNRAPEPFSWDGLDNNGSRLPDGEYLAELELDYSKGDHHEVRTPAFTQDTQAPDIKISTDYTLFSPDGDGLKDEVAIKQKSSREALWEAEVLDVSGEVVRNFYWKGEALSFNWDGKDENGNKIPDGPYTYRIKCTDPAGNRVQKEIRNLKIDTRLTPVFLTVSRNGFSPNGDGFLDDIGFRIYLELNEGIKSWTLELNHAESGLQKRFTGAGRVPDSLNWDGSADTGPAKEGFYRAVLSVEYDKGNRPQVKSTSFRLDISAPKVAFKMTPLPFSPDNDGVDDELSIAIEVEDLSPISSWSMAIDDPVGHLFTTFSGYGSPTERIIWDGLSYNGELVQAAQDYGLRFWIQDNLGNAKRLERVIPVDVLVIREGNKLKVRISSITFPPNSPDLSAVQDEEKITINNRTINRLAEIFTKYNTYQIRIEGHANNLSWADPAKAAVEEVEELVPLSSARAAAVKEALVDQGLQTSRISTTGLGGKYPVVPFSDIENRWKNRRVEFILVK